MPGGHQRGVYGGGGMSVPREGIVTSVGPLHGDGGLCRGTKRGVLGPQASLGVDTPPLGVSTRWSGSSNRGVTCVGISCLWER